VLPLHDENPTTGRSWLTIALIVINVVVFVWLQPRSSNVESTAFVYEFASVPCEVTQGRPLTAAENPAANGGNTEACSDAFANNTASCRFVPEGRNCQIFPDKLVYLSVLFSLFFHGSWLHLAFNMVFLWVFGNNIEDHLGRIRFALFYVAGGVVATVAHIAFNLDSTVPLIGASGAVAGVMGAYLVWFPNAKVTTLVFFFLVLFVRIRAKWLLLLWFASQFLIDPNNGIAWLAHVGGFAFGVLFALIVRESPRARTAVWTVAHRDAAQGLWDNRFGGRNNDVNPPYEQPGI
jgi:membrane associated rhomboid family serine protease